MERKLNIGIAPSRNFDKVTIEILDEKITFEHEDEFKAKVSSIFDILNDIVDKEFTKLQGGKI